MKHVFAVIVAIFLALPAFAEWHSVVTTDNITGVHKVRHETRAVNSINFGFPYGHQRPVLVVKESGQVYVKFSSANLTCPNYYGCSYRVNIDGTYWEAGTADADDGNFSAKFVFIPAELLIGARLIKIEVQQYGFGKATFSFKPGTLTGRTKAFKQRMDAEQRQALEDSRAEQARRAKRAEEDRLRREDAAKARAEKHAADVEAQKARMMEANESVKRAEEEQAAKESEPLWKTVTGIAITIGVAVAGGAGL